MKSIDCKKVFYISNSKTPSKELLNELSKTKIFQFYCLGKQYNQQLFIKQQYCDVYNLSDLNSITLEAECIIYHPVYLNDDSYETVLSNYDLILADNIIQTCKANHVRRILWLTTKYKQTDLQEHISRIECEYAKILKPSNVELIQLQINPESNVESIQKAVEFLLKNKITPGSKYTIIEERVSSTETLLAKPKIPANRIFNYIQKITKKNHNHNFLDRLTIPVGFHADSLTFALIHWFCKIPKTILKVEKNKNIISFSFPFIIRPLLVIEHNYLKSHREFQSFSILGGLLVKNRNKGIIIIREIPSTKSVMIAVDQFETNLPSIIYHWIQVPLQNLLLKLFQKWIFKISKDSQSSNNKINLSLKNKSV